MQKINNNEDNNIKSIDTIIFAMDLFPCEQSIQNSSHAILPVKDRI